MSQITSKLVNSVRQAKEQKASQPKAKAASETADVKVSSTVKVVHKQQAPSASPVAGTRVWPD